MGFSFKYGKHGGIDGGSQEGEAIMNGKNRPDKTNIQGRPINLRASMTCGDCGTSDIVAGRPGSKVTSHRCRGCQQTGSVGNGIGHTFPSRN